MARRSSNPEIPVPPGQVHATRRGGTRRDATERVRVRKDAFQTSGWTLNISRGGARLVLEEPVNLGQSYQIELGSEGEPREVRIVWAQDEADGQIVGVQFLDVLDGSIPPPPGARPSASPGRPSSLPPRASGSLPPRSDAGRPGPSDESPRPSIAPSVPPPKSRA